MPRRERIRILPIEGIVADQDKRDTVLGQKRTLRIVDVDPGVQVPFPSERQVAEFGLTGRCIVAPEVMEDEDVYFGQTETDLRYEPMELLDVLLKVQRTEDTSARTSLYDFQASLQRYREGERYTADFASASKANALVLPEEEFFDAYTRRLFSHMSQTIVRSALRGINYVSLDHTRTERFYNRLLYSTAEYPAKEKLFRVPSDEDNDVYLPDGLITGIVHGQPTILYVVEHGLHEQDPALLRQHAIFLELKNRFPDYFDYANFLSIVPDANPAKDPAILQTGDMTASLEVPLDTSALQRVCRSIATRERMSESSATLAEMRDFVRRQRQIEEVVIILRDLQRKEKKGPVLGGRTSEII